MEYVHKYYNTKQHFAAEKKEEKYYSYKIHTTIKSKEKKKLTCIVKMRKKNIWNITKQTFSDFFASNVLKLSGSLAFFTIFSKTTIYECYTSFCSLKSIF